MATAQQTHTIANSWWRGDKKKHLLVQLALFATTELKVSLGFLGLL
jgi:hypothetical protein